MCHIRMHSTDGPRWDLYIPSGLEQGASLQSVYKAFDGSGELAGLRKFWRKGWVARTRFVL